MILVADETVLRMYPPLRMAWGLIGQQTMVPISGENAKRVLFGAINIHTGQRILQRARQQRQQDFQAFLRTLRSHYRGRRIWLILDKHGSHQAAASQQLAKDLDIQLLFLPRQTPELSPMDHLWKEAKRVRSANRQYADIDEHAQHVEDWIHGLTRRQALRKAGILSKNFWLLT